jgi:glycosyltransferase involved in cell wall biosynthesis
VNGRPLVFFHFSGLNAREPESFSKHQDRFRLADLGPAAELVRDYCTALGRNGLRECPGWGYAFGRYADGRPVADLDRVYYRQSRAVERRAGDDPFRRPPSRWWLLRPSLALRTATLLLWRGEALARRLAKLRPIAARRGIKRLLGLLMASRRQVRRDEGESPAPAAVPAGPLESGLNIVGYIRSEHGVGESARRSAHAASAAGLPFCACDFNAGNPHRTGDQTWAHRLAAQNRFGVNLLHVNADQMPVARRVLGEAFFAGRYNIGYWHWELPELPEEWLPSFRLVDEVWVPTRFVQDAVAARSPVPVIRIPHAVHFSPDAGARRADLGLPAGDFLFLTLYDTFSIQARKNPWGAVEAFRKAFPDPRGVKLVVKVNNGSQAPDEVRALRAVEREYPGLVVLDRTLSRQEVYNLESLCDCLVSLHRSEGFGLCLAEAMFLGKPVIATDWSGNRDFMTADNSCPVRCRVVPLEHDYPPYRRDQVWAEPDVEHAAWYMGRVVAEPAWARRLGEAARQTLRTEFSPEAVGRRYWERLEAVARFAAPRAVARVA